MADRRGERRARATSATTHTLAAPLFVRPGPRADPADRRCLERAEGSRRRRLAHGRGSTRCRTAAGRDRIPQAVTFTVPGTSGHRLGKASGFGALRGDVPPGARHRPRRAASRCLAPDRTSPPPPHLRRRPARCPAGAWHHELEPRPAPNATFQVPGNLRDIARVRSPDATRHRRCPSRRQAPTRHPARRLAA